MIWIRIGGWIMFLGVTLGAFGAHGLKGKLSEYHLDVFKTAVLYHLIHGLGLIMVGLLSKHTADPRVAAAGSFLLIGIVLFSGSLYALSITGLRFFGAIAPLGGLSFICGWLLLALTSKI